MFDETWFKFELKGGPVHSELLVASATLTKGDMAGAPLPIHCKWYTMEKANDLKEIEGVSGAFFQPSIDDVGKMICVHAIPASDAMDYHGMPGFQEVGPLTLDESVKDKIESCSTNHTKFPVVLERNEGVLANLVQGKKYLVVVDESELYFEDTSNTTAQKLCQIKFENDYPEVKLIRNSGTMLVLKLNEKQSEIGFTTETNISRDVLAAIIRNKVKEYTAIMKKKEEEEKTEIGRLTVKCTRLEKENGLLKSANKEYMEQRIVLINSMF